VGLLCARSAKAIPVWLLVAATVSNAASASASSSTVVGCALMLRGGVAVCVCVCVTETPVGVGCLQSRDINRIARAAPTWSFSY
jgi:hypothetical protein